MKKSSMLPAILLIPVLSIILLGGQCLLDVLNIPDSISVIGAGFNPSNIVYHKILTETSGFPSWTGSDGTYDYTICWSSVHSQWEIRDYSNNDLGLYYNASTDRFPPKTGWQTANGASPPPKLIY
jgi:hypothetical protein